MRVKTSVFSLELMKLLLVPFFMITILYQKSPRAKKSSEFIYFKNKIININSLRVLKAINKTILNKG